MAYGNAAGSPGSIKSEGGSDAKPARTQISSFGADEELVRELPPNWTLRRFQEEVRKVVADYFQALTVTQAASQVQALLKDCPSEADELGALAIRAALDRGEAAQKPMVDLLCKLTSVQATGRCCGCACARAGVSSDKQSASPFRTTQQSGN
ncbi:unnamed protein product [Prorocentrum cordatum]|uniref:Uncharacterized protein n=1 Tax=Prorocentrum cordatum TaxID=2364126 RepID=A0ABN9RY47_9DINO|nr:unnamed protein product [Polarella glacialis]